MSALSSSRVQGPGFCPLRKCTNRQFWLWAEACVLIFPITYPTPHCGPGPGLALGVQPGTSQAGRAPRELTFLKDAQVPAATAYHPQGDRTAGKPGAGDQPAPPARARGGRVLAGRASTKRAAGGRDTTTPQCGSRSCSPPSPVRGWPGWHGAEGLSLLGSLGDGVGQPLPAGISPALPGRGGRTNGRGESRFLPGNSGRDAGNCPSHLLPVPWLGKQESSSSLHSLGASLQEAVGC